MNDLHLMQGVSENAEYQELCRALAMLERAPDSHMDSALRYVMVAAGEWVDSFNDRVERRCRNAEVGQLIAQACHQFSRRKCA